MRVCVHCGSCGPVVAHLHACVCIPLARLNQVCLALPGWGSSSSSHRGAVALQGAALHALVPKDVRLVQPAAAPTGCSSFWVELCGERAAASRGQAFVCQMYALKGEDSSRTCIGSAVALSRAFVLLTLGFHDGRYMLLERRLDRLWRPPFGRLDAFVQQLA